VEEHTSGIPLHDLWTKFNDSFGNERVLRQKVKISSVPSTALLTATPKYDDLRCGWLSLSSSSPLFPAFDTEHLAASPLLHGRHTEQDKLTNDNTTDIGKTISTSASSSSLVDQKTLWNAILKMIWEHPAILLLEFIGIPMIRRICVENIYKRTVSSAVQGFPI
jgi:hypothetical protein